MGERTLGVMRSQANGGFEIHRAIIITISAGLLALGLGEAREEAMEQSAIDLAVPQVRMSLDGFMAARLEGIIDELIDTSIFIRPEGLEQWVTKQRMPDLLAYLMSVK